MDEQDLDRIIASCHPPPDILAYNPPYEVLFHAKGKHPQRNIFKNQVFSEKELEKLRRLKDEIKKQKLQLPKDWDDSDLLKFVYGANFKTRGAFKALKSCLASYSDVFPEDYMLIYSKIYEILLTGPLYMHGRDCHYRPLLIMNFAKFDLKKYTFEQYLQAACFVLEFASKHMLFPGKVENWMCISDIGYRGLSDLPLNTLRKITQVLQDVFKCRLAYSAMINTPKTIYFIYSCLKPFLDPVTIDKISIAKGNVATNIIKYFNPYQVEERYGGKSPNLNVFWPPVFPNYPVALDDYDEIKPLEKKNVEKYNEPESAPFEMHSQEIIDVEEINNAMDEEILNTDRKKKSKKSKKSKRRKNKKIKETLSDIEPGDINLENIEPLRSSPQSEKNQTQELMFSPNENIIDEINREVHSEPIEEQADPNEMLIDTTQNTTMCSLDIGLGQKCVIS
ncbi:hypothetical protein SteCoe_27301 [Stentor coeruleus]|uniref:CRAL-TRIO domain-containing protein n=1 Tax=Stentor coeruleus TaxID=5963 RepID=A0A1R2BAX0_9CILI|nr:hypothetical protein SteCoe_27301 [Stentor coeruleus]